MLEGRDIEEKILVRPFGDYLLLFLQIKVPVYNLYAIAANAALDFTTHATCECKSVP